MNPGKLVFGTAAILVLCLANPVQAQITGFGGTGTNWTLNAATNSVDSPVITNNDLLMGTNAGDSVSAFYNTAQFIDSFTASFVFVNGATTDDAGFAFVLQNDSVNAVGTVVNNNLGYVGITSATGIAFDIDPQGNGPGLGYAPVAIPAGGPNGYIPTGPVNFQGTDPIMVNISYANLILTVSVQDTITLSNFTTNFNEDLAAAVQANSAFVGFSAGGLGALNVTISNFVFTPGTPPITNSTSTFPVTLTNGAGNIDVTKLSGNESDGVIVYNPQNPAQMFVAANTNVEAGLFGAFSVNGGTNWTPVSLTNLPVGAYPALAWDGYGNLFLAYVDGPFSDTGGIDLAMSTNGGTNFNFLTNLATGDFTLEPRIAVGTAAALGSVWVLYKDFQLAHGPLVAQGAAVTGSNAVGTFGLGEIVPGSTNDCGFGDIVVGPLGQVMVAYQNLYDSASSFRSPATNFVSVDQDGLGPNPFSPAVVAATNAIGGNTLLLAAANGQGVNAAVGLAWDTSPLSQQYNRSYLVYAGQGSGGSNDTDIFLSFSTDSGASWGQPKRVNDDNGQNSQFSPRVAIDPTDGILALSWYDCRNDNGPMKVSHTGMVTNDPADMPPTNIVPTNYMTTNLSGTTLDSHGNQDAQIYATVSLNGGLSFQANVPITQDTTNGYEVKLAVSPTDFGDYAGLTFYGGTFYPMWADNAGPNPPNPDGANKTLDVLVAPVTFSGLADVSITQVLTNTTNVLGIGSVLNYLLTMSNAGPSSVASASFTDVFPPNVTVVIAFPTNGTTKGNYVLHGNTMTWTVGALPNHGVATILVRTTAVGIGSATNFASISPGTGVTDLNTNNNTTTLVSTINGADLNLSVTGSPAFIGYGAPPVTYTVTVSNQGPVSATGVIISNVLSGNLLLTNVVLPSGYTYTTNASQNSSTFNIGTMTNGQTVTISLTAYAPISLASFGFAPVTCSSIALGVIDPSNTNNAAQAVTQIVPPDMVIGMTGAPSILTLGGSVTYTINVTNLGPVPAFGVAVTNTLPANLAFTGATLSPGGAFSVNGNIVTANFGFLDVNQTAAMTVTATAASLGQATNTATVGSAVPDANPNNNVAQVVTAVDSPDMALGMTGTPGTIKVGQLVTYTLNVTNLGPVPATGVAVTNTVLSNLSFEGVSVPVGMTYSVNQNVIVFNLGAMAIGQTAAMSVTAIAVSTGKGTNSAIVGDSELDTTPANNSAKVVTTINAAPAPFSNLTVVSGVTGVFITWNTPSNSTSQVDYGLTTATNVSFLNPTLTNYHVVMLTGLLPDTNYVFQIRSMTAAVPGSDSTNGSTVTILNGIAGVLYTTNGTFATASSLTLGTADASYTGTGWTIGATATGIFGPNYDYVQGVGGNPTASATYTPSIAVAGLYDISIWYPTKPGTFSSSTPMIANGTTNAVLVNVDQTVNGGSWQPLTTGLYFSNGFTGNLTIYNNTGDTSTSVVANGARWVYELAQDTPANGTVPAWWANFYFGGNVDGAADADGDGYSNYAEYVLGTDPGSKASSLQFVVTPGPSTNVTASFSPYQGGRIYQLQSSTNLGNTNWVTLTNLPALNTNNGTGSFTVGQTPGATIFYRLSASLSPTQ